MSTYGTGGVAWLTAQLRRSSHACGRKARLRPRRRVCFGGEGEVISLITRASAEELNIRPGTRVTASVKATALHVSDRVRRSQIWITM